MIIKIILTIILGFIGGFLGAWAGAEGTDKNWRRIGVPLLNTLFTLVIASFVWQMKYLSFVFLMSLAGALSLGYGIPDEGYPDDPNADAGSDIGRFWWFLTFKNNTLANILTRGTIGLVEAFVLLLFPLLTGNWFVYCITAPLLVFNNILWGAIVPHEGMYNIFGKDLLWEEHLIYQFMTWIIMCTAIFSLGGF